MPCPTDRRTGAARAKRLLQVLAVSAVLGAVAGCAQRPAATPTPEPVPTPAPALPAPPPLVVVAPSPPPPAEDLAARQLLAFHERLRSLPAAELAREQVRLANPASPADTLALALVLSLTRQPGDLARGLALLDPLVREPSPLAPLARLLQGRLAEQRRVEELAERQAQQLRDQQRRIEQLSQQLEALRAIERSLGTRPSPPPASAPRTP